MLKFICAYNPRGVAIAIHGLSLSPNVDPQINKPPPLRDPNIKALKRQGLINQGSTLDPSPVLAVARGDPDALTFHQANALGPSPDDNSYHNR